MEHVIECNNLTHYYGKRCIYENLNFNVEQGRIVGLLGKNGTGKTTTINIMNGYLRPHAGELKLFGEAAGQLSPTVKQRIALLLEGHIQYSFMNIEQIEKFYSRFYPQWNRDPYYELMGKLKIAPRQRISRMSCGQKSQVALGLILAQNADLLILDDFSMGLDPGYRRLFVDYLNEYVRAEGKTLFVTSHIIQDMERLIDDCIIMDYGRIVLQQPIEKLMGQFKRFRFTLNSGAMPAIDMFYHPEMIRNSMEMYAFLPMDEVRRVLDGHGVDYSDLRCEELSLEEIFIGLTGKY